VAWRRNGSPVWVGLPADELTAAVDALLTNVFQHTPEGTAFAVAVEAGTNGHRLVVEDEGPGIEATQAGRGTSGAGSTGLGLDIARQAATAGGGDLQVGVGARGGARVTLRFRPVPTTS